MIQISVILPVYNAAAYIRRAIESILQQSFTDFELLVINDGSADESEEIIQSIADRRIIYIKQPQNQGLIAALNKGISLAKGKYIARMDADDISLPHRFQLQWNYMELHPQTDVCGSSIAYFNEQGILRTWMVPVNDQDIKTELLAGSAFAHPSVFIRSSTLKKYQFYYSKEYVHTEDYELWVRMAAAGCMFYNISEVLVHYRVHNNNISSMQAVVQNETHKKIQLGQLQQFLNRELTGTEKQILFAEKKSVPAGAYLSVAKKFYTEVLKLNKQKKTYEPVRLQRALDYILLQKLNYNTVSFNLLKQVITPPYTRFGYVLKNVLKSYAS